MSQPLPSNFDLVATKAACAKTSTWKKRVLQVYFISYWTMILCLTAAVLCGVYAPFRSMWSVPAISALILFCFSYFLNYSQFRLATVAAKLERRIFQHDTQQRELEHGLRAPDEDDKVVGAEEWTPEIERFAKWALGSTKHFLPGDTVVKFGWMRGPFYGRGGYAIVRNNKVVAESITWQS